MKTILVGKIVKPQGIKGEVKMQAFVDNPSGFDSLQQIIINDKPIRIIKARANKDNVFLALENVLDRNDAEGLRGLDVYVSVKDAEALKAGDYFIDEIIGLNAYVEEELLGVIADIYQYGAADVLVVEGVKKYMLPFLKKAIKAIDFDKKQIIFDKDAFKEIAYEC